jgi:tocopherol cyclase
MQNPAYFRGKRKLKRYFEGWYFKCISADRRHAIAVIPGMAADKAGKRHAFIQVINAVSGKTSYFHFPFADFAASSDRLDIRIAGNTFDANGMTLDIDTAEGRIKGRLDFSDARPYPVSRFHPGIMGPFTFIPFMECYHAIIHLHHRLHGVLDVDGDILDFEGGAGYLEKDYGRSFPRTYLWLQAGHFEGSNASFVFSRARIPFLGSEFDGFFAYFADFDGHTARFATYNASKLEDWQVDPVSGTCSGRLTSPSCTLVFAAQMAGGGRLRAPVDGLMNREIIESITAEVCVELRTRDGKLLFQGTSREAGMEISIQDS